MHYALKKENEASRNEAENKLYLLWLSGFLLAQIRGDKEFVSYEDFIEEAFRSEQPGEKNPPKRTAEEILAEFEPIIERDRRKGGS